MRIEKRNFSPISGLEERAFCEGYSMLRRNLLKRLKKAEQMININLRLAPELV